MPRSLDEAYAAYWSARTRMEEKAAHRSILLYGGADGYRDENWRGFIARYLRRLAAWIDQRG